MIVAFALAGVIFINFVFCWHEISNQEREIDALKDKTEELKTRVIFLEAHSENEKARSALPEVENKSYII